MPPEPSFAPLALNESVSVDTPISRAANQTHSVTEKFSQWRSRLWGLCLVQLFLCMAFGVVYTELGYGATIFKGLNAVFHIRQIVGLVLLSCLGLFLCFEGYDTARWFHWTREWSARNYFALLVAIRIYRMSVLYSRIRILPAYFSKVLTATTSPTCHRSSTATAATHASTTATRTAKQSTVYCTRTSIARRRQRWHRAMRASPVRAPRKAAPCPWKGLCRRNTVNILGNKESITRLIDNTMSNITHNGEYIVRQII